jgi:hypothetical protein
LFTGAALTLALLAPAAVGSISRLLSPVGSAAALAGLGLVLWRGDRLRLFLVAAPFVAEMALLGTWREAAGVSTDFRRLVPVILPLAVLFIAVLVAEASGRRGRAWRVAWLLPVGLASLWAWQAWPVLRVPPLRGLHRQVALVAGRIPASAVVLSDTSVPSHLALALQSTFNRVSLTLWERPSSAASVRAFTERVLASGHPAFVIVAGYEGESPRRLWRSDFEGFDVRLVAVSRLQFSGLVPALTGIPRQLPIMASRLELYEVALPTERPGVALPLTIDVGDIDFASVLRGFHGRESMPLTQARWTNGEGQIVLPRLAPGDSTVTLLLRVASYRPEGYQPPALRLLVDGLAAGTIDRLGPAFATYRVSLDSNAAARLRAGITTLTLSTDTFVPKAAGLGDDARTLGVALAWVRLE